MNDTRSLSQYRLDVLKTVEEVLKDRCSPPEVNQPSDLATEEGRIRLAMQAGKHQLLRDIQAEISHKSKTAPRETTVFRSTQ